MAQGLGGKDEPLGSIERGSKYSDLGFRGLFWQMEGGTENGGRRQGTCLGQLCWTQRPGDGGEQVGRASASLHIPEQCFLTELAHTRAALAACCAHLAQLCVL